MIIVLINYMSRYSPGGLILRAKFRNSRRKIILTTQTSTVVKTMSSHAKNTNVISNVASRVSAVNPQ
jgi:hypothetical protein